MMVLVIATALFMKEGMALNIRAALIMKGGRGPTLVVAVATLPVF